MTGTAANVHRPTEGTAIGRADRAAKQSRLSRRRLADLLLVAHFSADRYGERLFSNMLDRTVGGAR